MEVINVISLPFLFFIYCDFYGDITHYIYIFSLPTFAIEEIMHGKSRKRLALGAFIFNMLLHIKNSARDLANRPRSTYQVSPKKRI